MCAFANEKISNEKKKMKIKLNENKIKWKEEEEDKKHEKQFFEIDYQWET